MLIEFGFGVAGECADGSQVIASIESFAPDVVLMDARMPPADGVQATASCAAATAARAALTTFDDDQVLTGMLRAGASGFVCTGSGPMAATRPPRVAAICRFMPG